MVQASFDVTQACRRARSMPLTQAAYTPHTMSCAQASADRQRLHVSPDQQLCSLTTAASTRSIASLALRCSLSAAAQPPRSAASAALARRRSATVAACAASSTASARSPRLSSASTAACFACAAAPAGSPARPLAVSSTASATRRGRTAPAPPPAAQPRVCHGRAASGWTVPTACSLAWGGTWRAAPVRRACHSTPAREQALHRGQPWSHASAPGSPLAPRPNAADVAVAI